METFSLLSCECVISQALCVSLGVFGTFTLSRDNLVEIDTNISQKTKNYVKKTEAHFWDTLYFLHSFLYIETEVCAGFYENNAMPAITKVGAKV